MLGSDKLWNVGDLIPLALNVLGIAILFWLPDTPEQLENSGREENLHEQNLWKL